MNKWTAMASTAVLALFLSACGDNDAASAGGPSAHAEDEVHEHGGETHTHEIGADTAGTYTDTTGAFFTDENKSGHDHGGEAHMH